MHRAVSKDVPSKSFALKLASVNAKMEKEALGEIGVIPIHKIPDGSGPGMVLEVKTADFSQVRQVVKDFAKGSHRVHGAYARGGVVDIGWWLPSSQILVIRSGNTTNQRELFRVLAMVWGKAATIVIGSHWLVGKTAPQISAVELLCRTTLFQRRFGVAYVGTTAPDFEYYQKKIIDELHKRNVYCLLYTESTQQLVSLICT